MKAMYFRIVVMVAASIMIMACGGPKSITKVVGEEEVNVPCSEQFSDKDFFRGQGIGQSKDLNTAREKARMAANAELAGSISTLIKQVSEKYVNDAGQSPDDYSNVFESLTKQVINQQISNVAVSCNKTFTKDGMYKVYMAVEAGKKEVFDALDKQAAVNEKIKTLYDREKFREQFDKEMEDFAKQRGI
ncbi:MAG: hypothetical protein LBS08_01465 [Candidatus Symbiothrix sp.]|nr:hypothetical protein [Candidatus Symbiothrix sp.]